MKITKSIICLICINVLTILYSYALDHKADSTNSVLKKNIIYGSVGYAGLYGVVNANYERIIDQRNTGFFKNYLVRVGGGKWVVWGGMGFYGVAGITGLTGLRNNHLEIHLGLTALYEENSSGNAMLPAAAVGYRYQKPGGHFVFRIGAAFPESFYLSLGFCF